MKGIDNRVKKESLFLSSFLPNDQKAKAEKIFSLLEKIDSEGDVEAILNRISNLIEGEVKSFSSHPLSSTSFMGDVLMLYIDLGDGGKETIIYDCMKGVLLFNSLKDWKKIIKSRSP